MCNNNISKLYSETYHIDLCFMICATIYDIFYYKSSIFYTYFVCVCVCYVLCFMFFYHAFYFGIIYNMFLYHSHTNDTGKICADVFMKNSEVVFHFCVCGKLSHEEKSHDRKCNNLT